MKLAQQHRLRAGRTSIHGQAYILTANCIDRQRLLETSPAANAVLAAMEWLDSHGRFELQGAVVMPDHFHCVVSLRDGTLGQIMHSLKGFTSKRINALLGLGGTVWQEGSMTTRCARTNL